jgi:acyl-CoA thioesterase I
VTGGPDVRVCVLGDSFTAGVGDPTGAGWVGPVTAAARAAGWELTAYGLGVRRDTSVDVARRFLPETSWRLRDGDRYGVVAAVGLNDVVLEDGRRRVARERSLAALAEVLDDAAARGWPALVVGPLPGSDAGESARAADLSAGMAQLCAGRSVPFVDTTGLADDAVWVAEVAAGDAYHPSTRGYARLAALVEPVFLRWLAAHVAPSSRAVP